MHITGILILKVVGAGVDLVIGVIEGALCQVTRALSSHSDDVRTEK